MFKQTIFVVILCMFVVISVSVFAEESQYDVRKVRWGMSIKQVKEIEAVEPTHESSNGNSYYLTYKNLTRIADRYFDVDYGFKDNHLSYAIITHSVMASEESAQDMTYLSDIILKTLKDKYDAMSRFSGELWATWHNDLYKDKLDMRNKAIALGHVLFEAIWIMDRTSITQNLRKIDESIELRLFYVGRKNAIYQDDKELL